MTKISFPRRVKKTRRMVEIALPEGGFDKLKVIAADRGYIFRGDPAIGMFLSEFVTENLIIEQQETIEE